MQEALLDDEEEEPFRDDDDDEQDEDYVEERSEDSESEQDISDVEIETSPVPEDFFIGTNKSTKWKKNAPPKTIRTRSTNFIKHLPGPKTATKNLKDTLEIWKYFFTRDMLHTIIEWTNQHINPSTFSIGIFGRCLEIKSFECKRTVQQARNWSGII
ncbi:hypothetical protein MML48_9g00007545 [Holotrichia oblita]|uniref:Uncharacterized protein n=1 Tax=Holotrichia oblita TaxID=644536 RepID=A0ACB9SNG6_HOLOL|nr:hypothetical protein MML48_9g00007545 [Holotrichia oblita]